MKKITRKESKMKTPARRTLEQISQQVEMTT